MGWYRAVGRRAFFAMPPESAHRAAGALLGLPLPWRRLGGASTDPALATTLAGVALRNPIGLAAGFDKTLRHLDALGELGFGYVVGGTITRAARAGNPRPRIARSPAQRSMTNAMGLPNPGAEPAAGNLTRTLDGPAPRFVSLADEELADAVASLELLAPLADGVELNASCPNVSWGRDRDQEAHLRELVLAFVAGTDRPVFVKLPPFLTQTERDVVLAMTEVAQASGAAGLTCANTRLVVDPRLATGQGGLSGRALWPDTATQIAELHAATDPDFALNACGGIFTVEDVVDCLEAGATTVQVYSALIYEGPGVIGALTRGLAKGLRARGLTLGGNTGTAQVP